MSLLAAQVGLNKLPAELRAALAFVPNQIDKAIHVAVEKLFAQVRLKNAATKGMYDGLMVDKVGFSYRGVDYVLYTAEKGGKAKVFVAKQDAKEPIAELKSSSFSTNASVADMSKLLKDGNKLAGEIKSAGKKGAKAKKTLVATVKADQQTVFNDEELVKADAEQGTCKVLGACFAAGTKLWTPDGYRNVEDIQPGEMVFARDEFDPDGPIEAKVVEAKFERTGRVLHLHLPDGKLIRTTPEHPFFVYVKGWTEAGALEAGDEIRTGSGWTTVEEVFDTGCYETVYNLRVAEWHTYFVGEQGWSFVAWAHNAACGSDLYVAKNDSDPTGATYTVYSRIDGTKWLDNKGNEVSKSSAADAKKYVESQVGGTVTDATKKSEWGDIIDKSPNRDKSPDQLGRTKPQAQAAFVAFTGTDLAQFLARLVNPNDPSSPTYGDRTAVKNAFPIIHAHHIVLKKGTGSSQIRNSHLILRTVGIDPYFSLSNLAWEPLWPAHANRPIYANQVNTDLSAIVPTPNNDPTAATIATMASTASEVVAALKTIATDFFTANYNM